MPIFKIRIPVVYMKEYTIATYSKDHAISLAEKEADQESPRSINGMTFAGVSDRYMVLAKEVKQ